MTDPTLVIRRYDARTDLTNLSTIWFDASLIAHPFMGRGRLTEQRRLIEDVYLPSAETWVVCIGGEPAGFISLLGTVVGGLFVAPDRQGHGIGRALIDHALSLTGELTLEVYTANTRAMRFYEDLGFQERARRDVDDLGLPFPNVTMSLTAKDRVAKTK